jgi:hypothetical protein
MKTLLLLLAVLLTTPLVYAQPKMYADSVSRIADSLEELASGRSQFALRNGRRMEQWTFTRRGTQRYLRITWQERYQQAKGDYAVFTERYLVQGNKLLMAYEGNRYYSPSVMGDSTEAARWGQYCFFRNEKAHYSYSYGHGKSEMDEYDAEKEALRRWKRRWKTLRRVLPRN